MCKLNVNGVSGRAERIYGASVDAPDIGFNVVGGAQLTLDSDQGLCASISEGDLSGGKLLWYTALREAQEHIWSGRLTDFTRLVFAAPCHRNIEFQWGLCRLLGDNSIDPRWVDAVHQHAIDFLAELYKNGSLRGLDEGIGRWVQDILRQVAALPEPAVSGHIPANSDSSWRAMCSRSMT